MKRKTIKLMMLLIIFSMMCSPLTARTHTRTSRPRTHTSRSKTTNKSHKVATRNKTNSVKSASKSKSATNTKNTTKKVNLAKTSPKKVDLTKKSDKVTPNIGSVDLSKTKQSTKNNTIDKVKEASKSEKVLPKEKTNYTSDKSNKTINNTTNKKVNNTHNTTVVNNYNTYTSYDTYRRDNGFWRGYFLASMFNNNRHDTYVIDSNGYSVPMSTPVPIYYKVIDVIVALICFGILSGVIYFIYRKLKY